MKNFYVCLFFVLVSFGLSACGPKSGSSGSTGTVTPTPGPKASQQDPFDEVTAPPTLMTPPASSGVSDNSFTIQLSPGEKEKRLLVPYHYSTHGFSKITVNIPTLKVDGCQGMAEVVKFKVGLPGEQGDGTPAFYWARGWVDANDASIYMGYGIEEDITASQETIVLVLKVPSDCTGIRGNLSVQFK